MKRYNKIIALFLAFAIAFSLVLFMPPKAHAASSYAPPSASGTELIYDGNSISAWSTWYDKNSYDIFSSIISIISKDVLWDLFDSAFRRVGCGSCTSLDDMESIARAFNMAMISNHSSKNMALLATALESANIRAVVAYDPNEGIYRLQDAYTGLWFVNTAGHFPYYREPSDPEQSPDSGTPGVVGSKYVWKLRSEVQGNEICVLPLDDLKTFANRYSGQVAVAGEYYMILDVTQSKVLCASGGKRLVAYVNPEKTAADQTYNYFNEETNNYNEFYGGDTIINEGDEIVYDNDTIINNSTTVYEGDETTYNQFINIHDNTFQSADGNIYNIDELYYDGSTHSYYVNAHDEYVYNYETNEYVTNNYTFKVTYDIHYTSVTYIGQTEEFEADTYVYYYQLPDGRSSADLTAEDLEQLSLAFTDVVNYARSTDAADMRVLYHFDGNTEDSSYWSYCTEFDWSKGASLTYLDEGIFNGSLYLDETAHEFSIKLPNGSDATYDFTLQFRYYQSATENPVRDSYVRFGEYTFLQLDGSHYYTGTGLDLGATSVGAWNEICMMRADGVVYYYINGVCVESVVSNTVFPAELVFVFGSEQQTYKKLDELRYTRNAVYTPGVNYTPTSVPFDSNLTLILPDGERPVADEVAVVIPSENNLLAGIGLSDWSNGKAMDELLTTFVTRGGEVCHPFEGGFALYGSGVKMSYSGSFTEMSFVRASMETEIGYSIYHPTSCLFFPLSYAVDSAGQLLSTLIPKDTGYLFTVVYSDGAYDSFRVYINPLGFCTVSSSGVGRLTGSIDSASSQGVLGRTHYTNGLVLTASAFNEPVEIIHMEFVEGDESQYSLKWESAMYTSGELENSPVLAVRSNTPISSYIFGGVRPSYPDRGMVWAMIEGHRIVSLQQYTGSAWVEVDGRIWTGSRWIPYGSFDVFTLQDLWDIPEAGEGSDFEYIYTESGFWAWWQRQWNQFTKSLLSLLEEILNASGEGGNVTINIQNNTLIDDSDKQPFDQSDYTGIVKILRKSYGFFSGFFDFIFSGTNNFLDHFTDTKSEFYGLFFLNGFGG